MVSTPALLAELDKLCIARDKLPLVSPLCFRPGPNYVVAKGRATNTSPTHQWNTTVLSTDPLQNNDALHLRFMCPGPNLMVGVAPPSINQAAPSNFGIAGCYMQFSEGKAERYHKSSATPGTAMRTSLGTLTAGTPKDMWVKLSTTSRTLEFSLTTPPKQWHVAYSNVDCSQPLHLCVLFLYPGAWVEVITE